MLIPAGTLEVPGTGYMAARLFKLTEIILVKIILYGHICSKTISILCVISRIYNINYDFAEEAENVDPDALGIEECDCLPEWDGLSCQVLLNC